MLIFFYFIATIISRSHNKIKLQNYNDMIKFFDDQDSTNNSVKKSLYNDENELFYCVGTKLNRCQFVSQNKVTLPEQIITESNVNEKILQSDKSLITFFITASVEIQLNVFNLIDKNVSFYADSAANSTIVLIAEKQSEPPEIETPENPPESEPTDEVPIESSSEAVLSSEGRQIKRSLQDSNIFLEKLVLHGISLTSNFSYDINFHVSELILEATTLLKRVNNNGSLVIDRLDADFSTIISSDSQSKNFFQTISNLTIDGENTMTTIHFQENYTYQISNVGSFLEQTYNVYRGSLPDADYLYFITNRRLDLESDYQMPVAQPHYNKSGVFLTSNYPYIQFTQSNKGLWTEEAQTSIELFLYEGRRLTLSGNYNKMNTTYYQINDGWEDSFNLHELNDRALAPIIGSCLATFIVFVTLYCLTVGRTKRKYTRLETTKNINSIDVNAKPVVSEKVRKRDKKKRRKNKN